MPPTSSQGPLDAARLERETRWLRALARAMVRDEHAAADLAQDAWVKALEAPPHAGLGARAWWRCVLRRAAQRRLARDAARRRREAAAARAEALPAADRARERAEIAQRVANAVAGLAEPYRSAIVLRYSEELPPLEIARQLGVPVATVKSRLARGLRELRTELERTAGPGRETWLPALSLWALPQASSALAWGTAKAWIGSGATVMKAKTAIAAGLLLFTIGAGWQVWRSSSAPPETKAIPEDVASSDAPSEPAELVPRADSIARRAEAGPEPSTPLRIEGGSGAVSTARRLLLTLIDFEGLALDAGSVEIASGTGKLHDWIRERTGGESGVEQVELIDGGVTLTADAHLVRPAVEHFVALELLEIRGDSPAEIPPQTLRVDRARSLELYLIDAERKPVADIEVQLGPDGRGKRERSGGALGVAVRGLEERIRRTDAGGKIAVEIGTHEEWHLSTSANDVWGSAYRLIEPGEQDLRVELELQRARGPRFRGRVLDPNRAPVVGARVFFPDVSGCVSFTDAEGRFGFTGAPFFYGMRVEAEGFAGKSFHPLESGLETERVIVLESGGMLAGFVLGAYGVARQPCLVEAAPLEAERASERDALRTDASGNFVFRFLREGPHVLRAVDEEQRTIGAARVNVPDSEVELRLGRGLEHARGVRGVARDAREGTPLPLVRITGLVARGEDSLWHTTERLCATTDEHGRFEIADLPWEPVMLSAEVADRVPLVVQPRLYPHGRSELELLLDREASVEIRVVDAESRTVAEAQVTAQDEQGHALSLRTSANSFSAFAHTDPEGRARLDGLPAKRVVLFARTSDWQSVEPVAIDAVNAGVEVLLRLPVAVSRDGRSVELELACLSDRAGSKATLRVLDAGDRAFAHLLLERDGEGWFARLPAVRRVPSSGRIAIELPDVELRVRVSMGDASIERPIERSDRLVKLAR